MATWKKYLNMSLYELEKLPTLHQGQYDNTKIIDKEAGCEVLLSRMNVADGAEYENQVSITTLQGKVLAQYGALEGEGDSTVWSTADLEALTDIAMTAGAIAAQKDFMPEGYDSRELVAEMLGWAMEFEAFFQVYTMPDSEYKEMVMGALDGKFDGIITEDYITSVDAFAAYKMREWAEARRPR